MNRSEEDTTMPYYSHEQCNANIYMTMLPTTSKLELVIREQVLPSNHQWHTPYMNKLASSYGLAYVQK